MRITTIFLVMPKYWGKQIFTHGSFPEVGQKHKTELEKRKKKKEDRKLVITMASYGQGRKKIGTAVPPVLRKV